MKARFVDLFWPNPKILLSHLVNKSVLECGRGGGGFADSQDSETQEGISPIHRIVGRSHFCFVIVTGPMPVSSRKSRMSPLRQSPQLEKLN